MNPKTPMRGCPPEPDSQVTLANWRTPPFNRWAFHHVREIVPSADIPHDPAKVLKLGSERPAVPCGDFFDRPTTDALVVVHRGAIVHEHYANGMTEESPHILMSVSKSMLGLLAGILSARGELQVDGLVEKCVPETKDTAYRGATLRHLLDMRAGIAFDEDYLATSGPIVEYRKATGWNPLGPGERPSDLRSFYSNLKDSAGRHGGKLLYVSPNTDLLGWVIERATGRRYADLMSELLWKPMGAERSAYITVDRLGAPRCAGGMNTTARDLARVGQMIVEGRVVAPAWIDDLEKGGEAGAWKEGNLAPYFGGLPIRYRSKWYVLDGAAPLLFGFGIHGQFLWVDRKNRVVIAKFSSEALPMDAQRITSSVRAAASLRDALVR
jgi:CubicO group peptidase (beta-lactamase class C family)